MAVVGAATTLGLDQVWLQNWANSGVSFPIGQRAAVSLPAGSAVVYYESPVAVPVSDATLRVFDGDGERLRVENLDGSMNYHLLLTGWSGRALWRIYVPVEGRYEIRCDNHSVASDKDIHPEDRVVFLKQPNSFAEVKTVRTIIQVTGATVTMTLVIIFYLLHTLTLQKRRKAEAGA